MKHMINPYTEVIARELYRARQKSSKSFTVTFNVGDDEDIDDAINFIRSRSFDIESHAKTKNQLIVKIN